MGKLVADITMSLDGFITGPGDAAPCSPVTIRRYIGRPLVPGGQARLP